MVSPVGNVANDAGFAWCEPDELVIGGGGTCTAATAPGFPNGAATAISSMPLKKGTTFPYAGFGTASASGWYYDCNGNPSMGGIAQAVVACLKP